MEEFVARLEWEGQDLSSNMSEGGLKLVALNDVIIEKRETTKGEQMITQRMIALGGCQPSPEEFKQFQDEIFRDPSATDVVDTWFVKSIPLSPNYYIGYAEHPMSNDLEGFGFCSGTGAPSQGSACRLTFSWDWFNVIHEGKAAKLQEDGDISFAQTITPAGREISRMVFDSQVRLRIAKMGSSNPMIPDWSILVHQGSEICWPSLIDGQLIANGTVKSVQS